MRTAIYIEQGITQLVLTPENDWEKKVCLTMTEGDKQVRIMRGSFYNCRGGWVKHGPEGDESLILKVDLKAPHSE